ncbi:hypothetical protein GCM10009769_08090 [Curtobacterium luteum]|nr:hypothetical protein GCM10009769_08090 [Curtobacterium luteum]
MSLPDVSSGPDVERAGTGRAAATRRRPFALLGSELGLLFRRRRTWAMLGALALVPILIAIAVRATTGP